MAHLTQVPDKLKQPVVVLTGGGVGGTVPLPGLAEVSGALEVFVGALPPPELTGALPPPELTGALPPPELTGALPPVFTGALPPVLTGALPVVKANM